MNAVRDENFIYVAGWMISRIGLTGNDLLVYAVIYGFTQDGSTWYEGSRKYIAEFIGTSERTIDRILEKLIARKLVCKEMVSYRGVEFCRFKANVPPGDKMSSPLTKCHPPMTRCRSCVDRMTPNNNIDNIDRIVIGSNRPKDAEEVIEYAAECGISLTPEQAEFFISKNQISANGDTWMNGSTPVRNWKALAKTWMPGWRKYQNENHPVPESNDLYQKKRNPEWEANGTKWIPQLNRYETENEQMDREAGIKNPYNL